MNNPDTPTSPNMNSADQKLTLTFCGGVGSVTGANFLLEGPDTGGKIFRILVDCGLEQGSHQAAEDNRKEFTYKPSEMQMLFITHAHTDHIGRIPKLVKDGFNGVIYSTPETRELSELMLHDALKLTLGEAMERKQIPLYEAQDVAKALSLWQDIPYYVSKELAGGLSVFLRDAGHVLGSTMYEFSYSGPATKVPRKIVFTGDLGNSPTPLLRDTDDIIDADYIIMESVYGDRNHEDREDRLTKLQDAVKDTVARGGVLLIPSFSLEKTQEILYEFNRSMESGEMPRVPVYMDSPLAIHVTEIYKKLTKDFNPKAVAAEAVEEKHNNNIFTFPGLKITESAEDSKMIKEAPDPKVIIAGSGMSNGGRILHHEMNYLQDKKTILLLIGYQAAGTLGRQIEDGNKEIMIYGQKVAVNAEVRHIDGYSSHKDSDHLIEFVAKDAEKARRVFVVMGENSASLFLVQRLRDYVGVNAYHPTEDEKVILD